MKKYLSVFLTPIALLSMLLSAMIPVSVQAQTVSGSTCYTFTRNLGEGRAINTAEASALAQDLTNAGLWNAGTSITTYNDAVASAVSGFQEKYASQILTPNGLTYGTGYVGASTRAELNSLYGCSSSTTTTGGRSFQCPSGWSCTAPAQQTPVTYSCPTGWVCTPSTATTPTQTTNPSQSQSTIQIISPTSGQTVSQGSYLNIEWQNDTAKAGQNVTLYIRLLGQDSLSGGAYTQIVQDIVNGTNLSIASSIPSDGQQAWLVPSTVPAGQYEIQVIESLVGTAGLPTDIVVSNPFTITAAGTITSNTTCPSGQTWNSLWGSCTVQVQSNSGQPYVSIMSPNGGETYTPGQTVPISFSTNLTSQQAPNGFNILAYYGGNSTNVGSYSSGVQTIATNWTGGSPYNWTVPSSWSTGNYVIYIVPSTLAPSVSSAGLFAFGNSYFTIASQPSLTLTCSNGGTWNGSTCGTTSPTLSGSPSITNVQVDKTSYNIGDSYTVTYNLANAPANGHIGIALENQSGVRVYNIVNTCDYVTNCVNIPATSGAGTYTGTIPAGVGSIGSSVSNGQYEFEVELITNGAFTTDGVSQKVSIPLGGTTSSSASASVQVSPNGAPTISKVNITPGGATILVDQYTATFNVNVQAVGASVTLGLPNSSSPAFAATTAGIQINKNGSADSLSNYNPVVSYSTPSGATSNGTNFTISAGTTVTIPVTVSFTITNPGANVYSAQLLDMGWSSATQSGQIAPLGGMTWQTPTE